MKTLKITRGKFSTLGNGVIKEMGGSNFSWICANVTDAFDDNPKDNKAEHNAEFIAEAFNVANETGLTPRQLLEIKNELLEGLGKIASMTWNDTAKDGSWDAATHYKTMQKIAQQAIKKSTS